MIFRPDMVDLIVSGRKTQTRRRAQFETAPRYVAGRSYAVQPGRGKKAVCRIRVLSVRREPVRSITEPDAIAEGFDGADGFLSRWRELHGQVRGWCWRIEFALDTDRPAV